jgi:hypothetical protein
MKKETLKSFVIGLLVILLISVSYTAVKHSCSKDAFEYNTDLVAVIVDNHMALGRSRLCVVYETDSPIKLTGNHVFTIKLTDNDTEHVFSGRAEMLEVLDGDYTNGATREVLQ